MWRTGALTCILSVALAAGPSQAQLSSSIDPLAARRATLLFGSSRVIVSAVDTAALPGVTLAIELAGGTIRRPLPIINALVADLPNAALTLLSRNPLVAHVALDRLIAGSMERTSATVGATAVHQELGYDGSGMARVKVHDLVSGRKEDIAVDFFAQAKN